MQHLPTLIDHSDAPVAEASNITIYLISREAGRSVKMVLTGEGSDELWPDIPKHSPSELRHSTIHPARPVHRRVIEPLVRRLP